MEYLKNKNTGQIFVANPILKERKDMVPVELTLKTENIPEQTDLTQMKKEDLLEIAEMAGIKAPANTKKADIIDMIRAQEE